VFSTQALRTYQQHTLQSFKTTFLSRYLDPRVVTSITCHSYFLEGVFSANVVTVKKEQKELRNSNNVLLLSPLAQISRRLNNYDIYYIILE